MAAVITLNGINIETAVPGIKIEDIRVSPISLQVKARDRAIETGQEFVRIRGSMRTIIVTCAILEDHRDARRALLDSLTQWARHDTPKPMGLPNHDGKLIDVICTALPDLSTRQWWDKLSMTFTSYEPYFYSDTEKTGACGSPITVGGTAKPLMQITRTLAAKATNQSYGDGTHTMTFSEIPAGDLVIDLNRQTAAVGSSSIMPFYSYNSSFIVPRTGTYTITGTGTVKWRERWE